MITSQAGVDMTMREQPGKATLVPAVKTVDRSTLTAKDYDLDAGSSHVVK